MDHNCIFCQRIASQAAEPDSDTILEFPNSVAYLGRWQFYTAGVNVGTPQDAFGRAFTFTEVSLGDVVYDTSGKKVFRFTTTGKNSVSAGYGTAWLAVAVSTLLSAGVLWLASRATSKIRIASGV